jgi:redox-sensitive bicupin YhaK (pirin superfamily)
MLTVRRSQDRGHAQHGWLDSHHTFSFADYYDPAHMGFRGLRVINEDRVAPARGFGTHGHKDMEIISYVLEGGLVHKDSLGNGSEIHPGDVQRMSAGTGVQHSEHNASSEAVVHFLQIWLLPVHKGLAPGYEQKTFSAADKRGRLRLVAAPDGREGAVVVHSDAVVYAGLFDAGESAQLHLAKGRHAWVQVARGRVRVNDTELETGDGAAVSDEDSVRVEGVQSGEILVFDLG